MFFEETCKPRISDFEKGGKISLTSIMCILEDVGAHHSAYANDDVLQYSLAGSAWVCTNWRIRIIKPPAGNKELQVTTWARVKTTGAAVLREYTICDQKGELLVIAQAKFVRLDLHTGKPVRITDELYDAYEPEECSVFEEEMERLTPPEGLGEGQPVPLRKSDVDFNGHVHNTRYIDIAAAGIPEEQFDLTKAKELNIAFRKALKASDQVSVVYALIDGGCFISVNNQHGPCCYMFAKL